MVALNPFVRAFTKGTEGLRAFSVGACPGCEACGLGDDPSDHERDRAEESHFSWRPCEACHTSLGGDRHPAHYLDDEGELCHMNVCTDCLVFAANGDEPEDWRSKP